MVAAPASRRPGALFWLSVAVACAAAIFVLPLHFPPRIPAFSSSYSIGFNNRVAAVATAATSFAVACWLWRRGVLAVRPAESNRMPRRWLVYASLAAIAYTALFGWRIVQADIVFSDAGYFLTQMARGLQDHATLYRDFEFPYGHLLFYWPVVFVKVLGWAGVGAPAAYMVSLAAMQVAGLGVLFYVLEQLPLSRRPKGIALCIVTFGTLTPLLGLNYTLFRFALPYAALLWIAKQQGLLRQALLLVAGEIMMLLVSVEIGIAFAGGAVLYAIYVAATVDKLRVLLAVAPVAGFGLFAALVDKGYFRMLAHIGAGSFNIPVEPLPHVCVFLVAAVALAPIAVAGLTRADAPVAPGFVAPGIVAPGVVAPGVVAMYGASLGMIPSALGHCDGLHIFFSGVGFCLLSLIAVEGRQGLWPKAWLIAFALLAVYSSAGQASMLFPAIRQAVFHGPHTEQEIDVPRLESLTGGRRVMAPLGMPPAAMRALRRDGRYDPGYFDAMVGVWDGESEQIKVAEMHRAAYVLLPARDIREPYAPNNGRVHRAFRLGYVYPELHPPYVMGSLVEAELAQHWKPLSSLGGYVLYAPR